MSKSPNEILTFKGGIHPAGDGKSLSSAAPVQVAPLLDRYRVVISENVGKPPKPVVKVGDSVKKYQLIAAADGFVSSNLHSPTSGKVAAITEVPGAMGVPVPAIEIEADVLFKGTRVDGVYTADPEKDPAAVKFDEISFEEVLDRRLRIMDLTAFTLCRENRMPIIVFDMDTPGNLNRVLAGEAIGTLVKP